jgi:hypothetical protein
LSNEFECVCVGFMNKMVFFLLYGLDGLSRGYVYLANCCGFLCLMLANIVFACLSNSLMVFFGPMNSNVYV